MLKPLLVAALLAASAVPAFAANNDALAQYEHQCGNVLNVLPQIVRKEAVAAIPQNAQVSVHSICTGVQLGSFGNAAGLGKTIAANPVLVRALRQWGYIADEVVGIQINGNTVQLYVHHAA